MHKYIYLYYILLNTTKNVVFLETGDTWGCGVIAQYFQYFWYYNTVTPDSMDIFFHTPSCNTVIITLIYFVN